MNLKISIITVCYNSEKTITDTIQSVLNQSYENVEHIIVDGASTDKTLELINQFTSNTSIKVVSERDNGIYDAMNKGIVMASGDVIGLLNADDMYLDDSVLKTVATVFSDSSIDACYADLVYVKQEDTNQIVRYWKSCEYAPLLFKKGWMPAHPTFFVKKEIYLRYGNFDLNYQIASDFELLFRFIEKYKIKTYYLPKVLAKMRVGGTTNKSFKNIYIQNMEIVSTLKNYYQDFSLIKFIFEKITDRILQFVRRPNE